MGRAEPGSLKALSNSMKAKGLNRLRWYCQLCQRSMRDENGFKQHTMSESHQKKALEAGRTGVQSISEDFSQDFLRNFLNTLKTSHGEKQVHANKFYQEVIQDRHHIHLHSTKWHSLTDFVKHLGKEGICRVEEKEDGLFIAWIDDSPEAMKRREALRRKELQDKGDEEREQGILKAQIERARKAAGQDNSTNGEDSEDKLLKRQDGEKITLSFGKKPTPAGEATAAQPETEVQSSGPESVASKPGETPTEEGSAPALTQAKPVSLKFGGLNKAQPKNAFKNAFSGAPKKVMAAQPKKMSEAERIMKEEMERNERKRGREGMNGPPNKKPKF